MTETDTKIAAAGNLVGRMAVYVAGDHNIFFPAVTALASIKMQNPDRPFDYYISFKEEHLSNRMAQILEMNGIKFIDVANFDQYGSVAGLSLMHEKRWPEELFYNWIAPFHFYQMGYENALKVDYDILCLAEYEVSHLVNPSSTFTALAWDVNLRREGLTDAHVEALDIPGLNPESVPYFNAGFVAINLKRYASGDLFNNFKEVYVTLQSSDTEVNMLEQVAMAIAAYKVSSRVSRLDESYNTRITTLPKLVDKKPRIRNIHYITQNKPWRPIDFKYLDGYTKAYKTCLYMYREAWLRYAVTIAGFSEFVDVKPPTAMESIGMYTQIFASHYNYQKTLASSRVQAS